MADIKRAYGASAPLTITLAGLPTSSSLLVGQESAALDFATVLPEDCAVGGRITTGSVSAAGFIEVWALGQIADTPVWPLSFAGANAARTLVSEAVKFGALVPVFRVATSATPNVNYDWSPVSLASLFGLYLPKKVSLFVTHSTGANLHATAGNHYIHATMSWRTA